MPESHALPVPDDVQFYYLYFNEQGTFWSGTLFIMLSRDYQLGEIRYTKRSPEGLTREQAWLMWPDLNRIGSCVPTIGSIR